MGAELSPLISVPCQASAAAGFILEGHLSDWSWVQQNNECFKFTSANPVKPRNGVISQTLQNPTVKPNT